jgi:periplasmic divalent cation tolerance protein
MPMNPLPDIVVILCTAPHAESEPIVRTLVNRRLVACVNIVPVRSCYYWKGEFCKDEEDLLIAKTPLARADEVISAIKGLHSYEIPEIIILPVIAGHVPYLEWVMQETQGSS